MPSRYQFTGEGRILQLLFYSEKIVRVFCSTGKWQPEHTESRIVTATVPPAGDIPVTEEETEQYYICSTSCLRVIVDKETLRIRYEDRNGKVLSETSGFALEEYAVYKTTGGRTETRHTVDGDRVTLQDASQTYTGTACHGNLTVHFSEEETLFGMGSHEEGYPSLKGQFVPLYQENMQIALPYFVSTKGYAYLFDCTSMMTFDATDRRYGRLYMDAVDAVDLYFIMGDDFDDVCRGYRFLTGSTPMLPKWAAGYIQSKERYVSEADLLQTAAEYRKLQIPMDGIIQDWQYWPVYWGDKHLDPARYPDPQGMMEKLHRMHLHLMISIWPNMSGDSSDRLELEKAGKLFEDHSVYNAFDEEARGIYWRQAREQLFSHGIDGWWCDSSEPFDAVWTGAVRPPLPERMKRSVDEFKKYMDDRLINAYSLMHSRGIYEGQRSCSEKRVINLTRSGYPGQHRYGTVVWSGDVSATWETLRKQIHIAQNYIACGEGYWNADAGAFFVQQREQWFWDGDFPEGVQDMGYRELYTRWLQFACFTPMMRSHGTDTPREVWHFGERGTLFRDAIEETIRLRYSLLPYFYSVHAGITREGLMPITPLALAFPEDRMAHHFQNAYMYGHEFLVCPVTRPMYYGPGSREITDGEHTVDVYLPAGGWYDYYTETYYEGGQLVHMDCPINRFPLFVRTGSIVPTAPVMQYTDEMPDAVYEVRIYEGKSGVFTLYEDAGDGYGYENGEFGALTIRYCAETGEISEEFHGEERFRDAVRYRRICRK